MLPLLYESTHPILSPDRMKYLGRFTKCKGCKVSSQINDSYEVSASFAINDDLINEIQNQRFLMAKPNPFDSPQFFEIYNYVEENNAVTVKGRHIKHCAYNNMVYSDYQSTSVSDTPQGHWDFCTQDLSYDNFFSFSSSIIFKKSMEIGYTKADTLGKFLEEMAQAFGGEFYYDNFNISFLQRIGSKKNYVLRWNRNITDPKLTLTADTVYSHVVAYGNFTIKDYGYSTQICSTPVSIGSGQKLYKIYMYDATNELGNAEIDHDQISSAKATLHSIARRYAENAGVAIQTSESPNLTVNYSPILDEMKEIALGDTINVALKSGRTVEAKITKTEFDSLAERWTAIELGKEKIKLSNYIARR